MALQPPAQNVWWHEPIDKIEAMWIIIALAWCLILFLWMPYWHMYGKQNLSNESYKTNPSAFIAKTEAMVKKHTVRTESKSGIPVVKPPVGDVYLLARTFEWYPILELEKNKTYKVHISSADYLHVFSLQPVNINLEIHPGYETVINLTPTETGEFGLVCNEYCGLGHHVMLGKLIVK